MRLLTTAAVTCLLATSILTAQGQVPNPTNKTGVIGLMHAIHSTNDVDKTLAFYQAVFGLTGQVRPFQSTGPQILTDSPGADLRVAMTQIKGAFNFELTQFGKVERQLNKQPDIADPGAPMLKIIVRDIDAIVTAAKKVNAPIITKGAAPVTVPTTIGSAKAIIMSRGLAGHSMGGYGALRIGMKRPDVFFSLYLMSSCCLTANRNPNPQTMAAAEAIKTREQADEASRAPGFGPSVNLASAAAWSPNPANPPLYLDLPVKDGKVRPDIVAKWVANAPLEMIDHYAENLKKYYAVAIEIGTADGLLASNKQLHDAMTRLRIAHSYEEYDGDHTNRVRERIEQYVLPFFSKNLAAPANPTSPTPRQ